MINSLYVPLSRNVAQRGLSVFFLHLAGASSIYITGGINFITTIINILSKTYN